MGRGSLCSGRVKPLALRPFRWSRTIGALNGQLVPDAHFSRRYQNWQCRKQSLPSQTGGAAATWRSATVQGRPTRHPLPLLPPYLLTCVGLEYATPSRARDSRLVGAGDVVARPESRAPLQRGRHLPAAALLVDVPAAGTAMERGPWSGGPRGAGGASRSSLERPAQPARRDPRWNRAVRPAARGSGRSWRPELGLRPIYHHKPRRVDGHLFITVIAYQLVQVRLRAHGEHASWTHVAPHPRWPAARHRHLPPSRWAHPARALGHASSNAIRLDLYDAPGVDPQPGVRKTIV